LAKGLKGPGERITLSDHHNLPSQNASLAQLLSEQHGGFNSNRRRERDNFRLRKTCADAPQNNCGQGPHSLRSLAFARFLIDATCARTAKFVADDGGFSTAPGAETTSPRE
jgi:hypothetical protein